MTSSKFQEMIDTGTMDARPPTTSYSNFFRPPSTHEHLAPLSSTRFPIDDGPSIAPPSSASASTSISGPLRAGSKKLFRKASFSTSHSYHHRHTSSSSGSGSNSKKYSHRKSHPPPPPLPAPSPFSGPDADFDFGSRPYVQRIEADYEDDGGHHHHHHSSSSPLTSRHHHGGISSSDSMRRSSSSSASSSYSSSGKDDERGDQSRRESNGGGEKSFEKSLNRTRRKLRKLSVALSLH